MTSTAPISSSFRPDIQGLRAIAVLSVVIFHAWPDLLPGGFIGVDIFFVISGFLIGGILRRDIMLGRFSIADFYRKRVRRIFPAFFTMIIITFLVGTVILGPSAFKELARTTVSSTIFLSNFDFYAHSGYFDPSAELRPLLHTWSLSVEEQFYIIFPLALLFVIRVFPTHIVIINIVAIVILIILSQLAVSVSPMGAYFLLPFRGFEFLIGSLAAYAQPKERSSWAAWIGFLSIFSSLIFISPDMPFPGFTALPATAGTALILWAGRHDAEGVVFRLLSGKTMLFFGAISFSLYLSQWPILAFLRILTGHPTTMMIIQAVILSIVTGWLSWRYVEQKFAYADMQQPILRLGTAGIFVICIGGTLTWTLDGIPQRFSPKNLALFNSAFNYSPYRSKCHQEDDARVPYFKTCILGGTDAPKVVVWGDSHGTEFAAALSEFIPVRQITASACPPIVGVSFPSRKNCESANDEILSSILRDTTVKVVFLTVNRERYRNVDIGDLTKGLNSSVIQLASSGKEVVLLSQIPNPQVDVPQAVAMKSILHSDIYSLGRKRIDTDDLSKIWAKSFADFPSTVSIFNPADILCSEKLCPFLLDDELLYFNSGHISIRGIAFGTEGLNGRSCLLGCLLGRDGF